jgi:hypothetical protein
MLKISIYTQRPSVSSAVYDDYDIIMEIHAFKIQLLTSLTTEWGKSHFKQPYDIKISLNKEAHYIAHLYGSKSSPLLCPSNQQNHVASFSICLSSRNLPLNMNMPNTIVNNLHYQTLKTKPLRETNWTRAVFHAPAATKQMRQYNMI